MTHSIRASLKQLMQFKLLKISQLVFAGYIAWFTFGPWSLRDKATGYFVDPNSVNGTEAGLVNVNGTDRAISATSTFQVACLGLARMSAWFMYPTLVFVFISKFRSLNTYLSKTHLALYMYQDSHELHVYCGWTIFICSTIHVICHITRWAVQANLNLLISHFSGITGLIIFLSCLLICVPMTFLRKSVRFEWRKNLHYLFIVFTVALMFHTPKSAIPNGGFTFYVFGTVLALYFLDSMYAFFFMTEKIQSPEFSVVPSGVRMTMNVSDQFQKIGASGGIGYICVPWVKKHQWHAFSLFENPSNPTERQVFIQKIGDWTTELHEHLQRETTRPVWISGPFPSPYSNAELYDNQILVASGIGVTPALSVINAQKHTRKINLIWIVRDPHLVDFMLRHMYLDHGGWNLIFYTGNEALDLSASNLDALTETNICIVTGRPDLRTVIPNIIYGFESQRGMPCDFTPSSRASAASTLADKLFDSQSTLRTNNRSRQNKGPFDAIAEDIELQAMELGFHLSQKRVIRILRRCSQANDGLHRDTLSKELVKNLSFGFRPWIKMDGAETFVKELDPKTVLPSWGVLYCGGAKQVLDDLEAIADEYKIGLHVESFEW